MGLASRTSSLCKAVGSKDAAIQAGLQTCKIRHLARQGAVRSSPVVAYDAIRPASRPPFDFELSDPSGEKDSLHSML